MHKQVLKFWFDETAPEQWWRSSEEFDALVRQQFLELLRQAIRGELYRWRASPRGRLAEVVVLDQFSRNIFRNMPEAFAQDPMALALAQEAVSTGALSQLEPVERAFLLLPYMHSESPQIHIEAELLYRQWAPAENLDFELRHKAVVDRFGRYPHRNLVLGRESTPEEEEFLRQNTSGF